MSNTNIFTDNNDICVPVGETENADSECRQRLSTLKKFYAFQFGTEPRFFVRVPGRVNIIGEHVDYCGYPVLPMAINQSILLAVGPSNDGILYLRNLDGQFENYKCDLESLSIDLSDGGSPKWYNYFLCGTKGIFEYMGGAFPKVGMFVAVSGNIPHSSGLSSSSALVSSATLATAYAYKLSLDRKLLASIAAKCERYIGTEGGGMDQAIAFLAEKGCAQYIQFQPELIATSIQLPRNACFVVANSLAEKNKAATSDFNERVVECRIACLILAKTFNIPNWEKNTNFAALQSTVNITLVQLEEKVWLTFLKNEYSRSDILELLELSDDDFKERVLTPNTKNMATFKLRQRALHVVQESLRVQKFKTICTEGIYDVRVLCELMRESHQSLAKLYECSHPMLDQLISISDSCNVGARLTGAGWGGCIVALCTSMEECQQYIKLLREKYYSPHGKEIDNNEVVFATWPQKGAEILLTNISNCL